MCGIAGYIHFDRGRVTDERLLTRMIDTLRHRGPDAQSSYLKENIALGHRRLSILDLTTGDQPQFNDDKSVAIIYNGEIYNYVELREELKGRGHQFRTQSDTEVIIRSYEQWGTECVQHFNGMWAFALWDEKLQQLFCSRDRLGEKPFFYAVHDDTFVFGSEIKALFEYGIHRELDAQFLDAYLCLGYVPAPYSMFRVVKKLPAGHSLLVRPGSITLHRYWDVPTLSENELRSDDHNILREFEELLHDSVRIRMRSDVPFGAFLSGGLDSSSVVAAMHRYTSDPIKTCTIGFDHREFDERALARLVVEKYKTDHSERIVTHGDAESLLTTLAWHYDEPFGDSSALAAYVVSKIARERVKVVLTGDGGDEVLSGYTIHQGEKFSAQFGRLPVQLRERILPATLAGLETIPIAALRRRMERARRVVLSANMDFIDRIEAKQIGFTRAERSRLIPPSANVIPVRDIISSALLRARHLDSFGQLNYWLMKTSLPDDMLVKVDRAAMASSLEPRVPFLDHRLVELMSRVSMKSKMKGYSRKYILRESIGRELPRELLSARKQGFSVPLREWVGDTLERAIEERATACGRAGLLQVDALDSIMKSHRAGKRDAGNALWIVAMLGEAIGSYKGFKEAIGG